MRQDIQDEKDEVTVGAAKDIHKKRVTLQKHLTQLRSMQAEYMPCVKAKLCHMVSDSQNVEHQKLWLPSELDIRLQEKGCVSGLAEVETQLHEAQCRDALTSLCSALCAHHSLFSQHNKNFWGQKQNTQVAETAH